MDLSRVIAVPKATMLERDMNRLRLTEAELHQFYARGKVDHSRVIDSHRRQTAGIARLRKLLGGDKFVAWNDLTRDLCDAAAGVIVAGGDNHVTYVSHFVRDTPIVCINSDVESSVGALTSFDPTSFEALLDDLRCDRYTVATWTRLQVAVDDAFLGLVTSEVFLGERERTACSRNYVEWDGRGEEQPGSGLLACTGAGSTGWAQAESPIEPFPRSAPYGAFAALGLYHGKGREYRLGKGRLEQGASLVVTSMNDEDGVVEIDPRNGLVAPFPQGSKAVIQLAEQPLYVIRSN